MKQDAVAPRLGPGDQLDPLEGLARALELVGGELQARSGLDLLAGCERQRRLHFGDCAPHS